MLLVDLSRYLFAVYFVVRLINFVVAVRLKPSRAVFQQFLWRMINDAASL